MQSRVYYTVMPDGTVKQLNPFTGTEVWSVGGRKSKPIANAIHARSSPLESHDPEDYCSFCQARYFEVAPEKSRLVHRDSGWQQIEKLAPDKYQESAADFRRVGNMFEIVTLDYWRKNYSYKLPPELVKWRENYLSNPVGLKHITDIVHYKLKQEGKTENQIDKVPVAD
ncbi:MAG: DUF4921 family protein, partial [Bacteroidetes bacterium]|nr:DUF4921 family protein [Bacteroidota bacterium]